MVSILQSKELQFRTFGETYFLAGTTVSAQTAAGFEIRGPIWTWVWGARDLTYDANGMPLGGQLDSLRLYRGDPAGGDWYLSADTNFRTVTPAILTQALLLYGDGQTDAATALIDDTLRGEPYSHSRWVGGPIYGTSGNDFLSTGPASQAFGYGGEDSILFGNASDIGYGGDDRDWLWGGGGDDQLWGDRDGDYLHGQAGNDQLHGGDDNDFIFGGRGHDLIQGDAGDDRIGAGHGRDTAHGGDGNDWIAGEGGEDRLYGNAGDDMIFGGTGADRLSGGGDNDQLSGGGGNDWLSGGSGNDRLWGDRGDDSLSGDDGDDTLSGGAGDDQIAGAAGNDTLRGGDGNDSLSGGSGNDTLSGGSGDDILDGGTGSDRYRGGDGSDTFIIRGDLARPARDMIVDHTPGQDQILLADFGFVDLNAALVLADDTASGVLFTFSANQRLLVAGTELALIEGDILLG